MLEFSKYRFKIFVTTDFKCFIPVLLKLYTKYRKSQHILNGFHLFLNHIHLYLKVVA
jgi:hypothetical protein